MEYKDYYLGLGVARNASAREIRSAFRKLALRYHPDRNPGDLQAEEKFKEINEAYQVLSEPEKRARYDQKAGAYAEDKTRQSAEGFKHGANDFSDLFNSMNWGPTAPGKSGFRTRRPAQHPGRKTKPGVEMHEFVIQELISMHSNEAITYALCENYDLTWQAAGALINDIRTQQAKLIRHRQAPWMLPAAFSMLVGGIGSTILGAYIIVFVATLPVRSSGDMAWLLVPQIPFFLLQVPALLGYAWLSVGTGIGLTIASARSIKDAWAALSEDVERRN